MGKFAAIGAALVPSLAAGSTAATLVGGAAVASAGLGIASSVKSLTAKPPSANLPPVGGGNAPSVPDQKQAEVAAQKQQKDQQRRATRTKFTGVFSENDSLLAAGTTTKKTLLGQ